LKRTATSTRELERVEVMGRVAHEGLKLVDAAAMLQLSYRKVKRMWRRYQQVGRQGMKHARAGRPSNPNRGEPMKLGRRVLNLIKKTQEKIFRFGGRAIRPHLSRRALGWWRWDCGRSWDIAPLDVGGAPLESAEREEALPNEGCARSTLANWCNWRGWGRNEAERWSCQELVMWLYSGYEDCDFHS